MATPQKTKSMRLDALWRPLTDEEVLVEGEIIHYRERQHWISILGHIATALILAYAILLILTWPDDLSEGEIAFAGFTFVFAAWFVHDKVKDWPKPLLYVAGAAIFILVSNFGLGGLAAAALAGLALKVLSETIARAYYRTIYLTNRRIIMTDAPVTRNISSVAVGRITDISVSQTSLGGVFNYFHLKIETAGQDQALNEIKYIKYSDDFYQDLIELSTQEVSIEREIQLPE